MKKAKPIWKKLLFTAAIAFVLGLVPYFVQVVRAGTEHLTFLEYICAVSSWLWGHAVRYAPHILTLYVLSVAVLIFLEGQNPDRTVLWLLTLAFLPIVGVILYVLLGPDMKRIQTRKLFKPNKCYPTIIMPRDRGAPREVKKISILAFRNAAAEIMERGEVRVLVDGTETFAAIKEALSDAKRFINIEYFIFQDDRLGNEIADILCERARAGVKVRMMTDGVGTKKFGRALTQKLKSAGVDYHTFLPVSFPVLRSGVNFRNHRKIIVVDGDVAFTGGLNVGVEYLGEGHLGNWRDTHARFRGEPVSALNAIFLQDWKIAAEEDLSPDLELFSPTNPNECAQYPFLPVQIVASGGSASVWRSIEQMYFMMISEAKFRIWITTPYLVPDGSIMQALQVAALSGVDVRILIPAVPDHFLVSWAGRSNIEDLLRAGVRIWMYEDGFVHAKTLLMDDVISSVGTANLDNRSLAINFEVQAFIYCKETAKIFERDFLRDLEKSKECVLSEWEKRSARDKVLESLGRLWSSQI